MINNLIETLILERKSLEKLLSLLEEQYILIMKNKLFELEDIVGRIKLCNKEVAEEEVNRRKIVGSESMKDIVENSNNIELDIAYRDIKKLIDVVRMQKDTNELLIRQQMGFNAQILNIINPRREIKTYNSYGNLSK
jgi:flagellar biosynthesis/type III secretory pathway chaperone